MNVRGCACISVGARVGERRSVGRRAAKRCSFILLLEEASLAPQDGAVAHDGRDDSRQTLKTSA